MKTKVSMIDKKILKAIKKEIESNNLYAENKEEVARELNALIYESILLKGTF